jgi:GNAT superfamily N-acetyltransferase
MEITVRKATPTDAAVLVRFNAAMAEETEGKKLNLEILGAGVRAVFEEPSRGFYVVAEIAGVAIGSLLVTPEWSDWRNARYWWVQSVYIDPAHRKKGVYKALHRYVEGLARESGDVCGIRLYVDSENSTAKAVYERLGMTRSRYEFFESGDPRAAKRFPDG